MSTWKVIEMYYFYINQLANSSQKKLEIADNILHD